MILIFISLCADRGTSERGDTNLTMTIKMSNTGFRGLEVMTPKIFRDDRGVFFESYNKWDLAERGIGYEFVQDNHSYSCKDTLRGLHYQAFPGGQAKLIRCTHGEILDVAVDVRKGSSTYLQHYKIILSADNFKQLLIPDGFLHGFLVLSDKAEVQYKCSNYYVPSLEKGYRWNDPTFNIDWGIKDPIISKRDSIAPFFDGVL